MRMTARVSHVGLDCHRKFSQCTLRDADGRIIGRLRLNHGDRQGMRKVISQWPRGTPVILGKIKRDVALFMLSAPNSAGCGPRKGVHLNLSLLAS